MLEIFAQLLTTLITALFILKTNTEKKVLKKIKNFFSNLHQLFLLFNDDKPSQYDLTQLPVKNPTLSSYISEQESLYYQQKYNNYDIEIHHLEQEFFQQTLPQKYSNNNTITNNNFNLINSNKQSYNANNSEKNPQQTPLQKIQKSLDFLKSTDISLQHWNQFNYMLMTNPQIRSKYINTDFQQKQDKLLRNCTSLKCTCIKTKKAQKQPQYIPNFTPSTLSIIFEEVGY